MWVLVIIGLSGSMASTEATLESCQRNFEIAKRVDIVAFPEVRHAYCQSAAGTDRVWIVKDGQDLRR